MKDMISFRNAGLTISFIFHFSSNHIFHFSFLICFFYHLANAFMMAVGLPLSSKAPFA